MIELGIPKVMMTVDLPAQRLHAARVEYSKALEEAMRLGLQEAIENADWKAVAKKAATEAIRKAVIDEVWSRLGDGETAARVNAAVDVAMREMGLG